MKNWISYIIIGALASVIVFLLIRNTKEKTVTVTKVIEHTIYDYQTYTIPHYVYEEIIRYDTLRIHDTINVPIPILQRVYRDSTYTAYVSGYKPSLDSITIRQKTMFVNTITTETATTNRSRWVITVGLNVGIGYVAPFNSSAGTIGMYTGIGVGLGYRL